MLSLDMRARTSTAITIAEGAEAAWYNDSRTLGIELCHPAAGTRVPDLLSHRVQCHHYLTFLSRYVVSERTHEHVHHRVNGRWVAGPEKREG